MEPRYTTYQGDAPARNYILAVNLHRRSLTRGQAAMIAVKACSESEQQGCSDSERSARSVSEQAGVSLGRVGQALTVLRYAEDYVDQVITGSIGLDEALKEASRRKAEAKSQADVETLAELRDHNPHLADEVEAGNLSLAAALVQRDADLAEEGRRRQVATDLLCQTLPALAQMQGSDTFARYDPERAQPERRVTRAVIDRARAALAEAAAVWEERDLA